MAAKRFEVLVGGSAQWGKPVRADENLSKVWYEASLMNRWTFEDGQVHYLRLRIVGIDTVDNDGEVPVGFGTLEFLDTDGDYVRGEADWVYTDSVYHGDWTITSGTGKWKGVTGKIDVLLNGMYENPDTPTPPTEPVRYFGFLEGEGNIEAPNLVRSGMQADLATA